LVIEMTLLRFVTETRMRQRFREQQRVAKLVADSFFQRMHVILELRIPVS
jgi:very-short-patch-repair endonuclease